MRKIILFLGLAFIMGNFIRTEDGYRLWLRYNLITDTQVLCEYCKLITGYYIDGNSETKNAAKEELEFGLNGLLGKDINRVEEIAEDGIIIIVTPDKSALLTSLNIADKLSNIGEEGYIITSAAINNKKNIVITANNEVGLLYGVFHFLRLLQTHQHINNIDI